MAFVYQLDEESLKKEPVNVTEIFRADLRASMLGQATGTEHLPKSRNRLWTCTLKN
jgi:hypothetical protein